MDRLIEFGNNAILALVVMRILLIILIVAVIARLVYRWLHANHRTDFFKRLWFHLWHKSLSK